MLQRRNECRNHTSSKCKENANAHIKETCAGKGTLGKIPPWVKASGRRGKVLQGLHISLVYKACFKGLVESNMEPTLGQRHKYENAISKTR
jgi:hypothetical protein